MDLAYERLRRSISAERDALLAHPVYEAVRDRAAMQTFMAVHVFAVWDFMALLKALQRRLTCIDIAWTPPPSRTAARLVNEIVLSEESDEIGPGQTSSHFELYLQAMKEAGADVAPIEAFIALLGKGTGVSQALALSGAPACARAFVEQTLALATTGEDEELAAAFLLGREDLVPAMFRRLLPLIGPSRETESFRLYLARHIDVDETRHGPLAERLLAALCGTSEARWARATEAARSALVARRALWDGVMRSRTDRIQRPHDVCDPVRIVRS